MEFGSKFEGINKEIIIKLLKNRFMFFLELYWWFRGICKIFVFNVGGLDLILG